MGKSELLQGAGHWRRIPGIRNNKILVVVRHHNGFGLTVCRGGPKAAPLVKAGLWQQTRYRAGLLARMKRLRIYFARKRQIEVSLAPRALNNSRTVLDKAGRYFEARLKVIQAARQFALQDKQGKARLAAMKRWYGQVGTATRRRPLAAETRDTQQVFLVVVRHHNGFGLTVCRRRLSCAPCHSGVRKVARPGDVVIAAKSVGRKAATPPTPMQTCKQLQHRVAVAGFQATKMRAIQ